MADDESRMAQGCGTYEGAGFTPGSRPLAYVILSAAKDELFVG